MTHTIFKKACRAALFIALGVGALLTIGQPIGPFLFALGLMAVCYINEGYLFTGCCGYIHDKQSFKEGMIILLGNLTFGFIAGAMLSLANPDLQSVAAEKVANWIPEVTALNIVRFFIKSCFCGIVMFTAVDMKKKGNFMGILLGVPLFIFCGWQHSIANIITCGAADTISWTIPICIGGNWLGSYMTRKMFE